ncbi:MAG: ribosome silencing factor [Bacteroidales bacterium]|nr:ribosome silencing factor [Bacteroidales bacterium]
MITHDLRVIADAIQDKKGQNVVSLDLRGIDGAIADYFVICNGDSTTNVGAIADNILKETKEQLNLKPIRMQGMENNFWVILDYGNIVIHVFQTPYREFYRLEDLWADAPSKTYSERSLKARQKRNGTE